MSSPSTSRVSSAAESIDSASPVCQAGEPWLPRSEELPNSPWYEEKSSTLRLSDIDIIKEKGGTMDDRMGKAELVKAMQEAVVAPPKKTTKKRKAPSTAEKEARGEKRKKAGASTSEVRTEEASKKKRAPTPPTSLSEEALDVPPVTATAGAPSSGKGPEQPPPFDPSKDSLVESPCPVVATRYICNMAPDRDVRVLRKARNADVVGHFSSNLAVAVAWGGKMVKRLTKAHQKMNASGDQFDKAMGQHVEVLARLEELETLRSREEGAAKAQREALEAQEAERLKIEGKEEFLKSLEFDTLLGKKAGGYFKNGFLGCVAQWRANAIPRRSIQLPSSMCNRP
ncbi:Late embryogenesis abundant hydroxyproline-rich glycofamily protein isoform 1 [Dorcoceras hygrometricum]|uniref:Late embryogenesis abundant hydroxyproline-rich glycofamily protein isoform 1 n=1 Tax=Dorcoceras hygrometricum TaxID=472368 RepID=A0A2Z7B370_9LAMI|nr:Late embryogenesis abundant hydroxyproline-rich glycofamily protein isoform 1 [Dorcoceras hygrometricum]